MLLTDIYQSLKKDLKQIEYRLAETIHTDEKELLHSSRHLLDAGGKRMRPLFVLLAGHFGEYRLSELEKVAVSLELIHMATLVHDDVIDDAETRRGRKTVKAEWDNQVAMYTGDFIFARALTEVAGLSDPRVHQILAKALVFLVRGEIDQIHDLYQPDQSLRRYLHRIKRKTALLMAISCQLGGIVSGASESVVRALYQYGYSVGMAFQMTDDVLDLTGDEKVLGKPAGSDLLQGNVTLPVIHILENGTSAEQQMIRRYLESRGTEGDLTQILKMVCQSEGIPYTLALSKRYLNRALVALEKLPNTHERESLRFIGEFIVTRSF
ncbi:heptaprenyl diphosphate synthase [Croceifilum oryzae]|uniref:Heptaprenyl diphosphate synthase n=1 Tax=Croceifilum oryzae TaxID=1553429 RepID=A0AAJ1WSS4_9BACL|nr:polyprenyl synthetase family protein [Croceifilum oryzae]MDQ0418030.1 heptaprenyl diphosphate synthase [Croceifilum oryzae]